MSFEAVEVFQRRFQFENDDNQEYYCHQSIRRYLHHHCFLHIVHHDIVSPTRKGSHNLEYMDGFFLFFIFSGFLS